jgi:hypothetical protein
MSNYAKYEVHWIDEDGDLCKEKCHDWAMAAEYKAMLFSLIWTGEKIQDVKIVEFT